MKKLAVIIAAAVTLAERPLPKMITVTAYCPCEICCGKWAKTPDSKRKFADGTRFSAWAKVCAVDRRYFLFGTRFEIPGYGVAIARDTGLRVKGCHIDILFPDHASAKSFGTRRLPLVEN